MPPVLGDRLAAFVRLLGVGIALVWLAATTAVASRPVREVTVRLVVDMDRCTGHGRCYALAPEVFDADDDGYCSPKVVDVPDHLVDQARLGERNCPEEAIALVGHTDDAGNSGGAS